MNYKQIIFINQLMAITCEYDGDGNGLLGESYGEIVQTLKKDYPFLFEIYKNLSVDKTADK